MSESKDIADCGPSDKHSGDTISVIRLSLQIKALDEDGDVRALDADGKPIKPATVQSYLQRAFKSRLSDAERALKVSASQSHTSILQPCWLLCIGGNATLDNGITQRHAWLKL